MVFTPFTPLVFSMDIVATNDTPTGSKNLWDRTIQRGPYGKQSTNMFKNYFYV